MSQKYRHRGYRDSEREESRERSKSVPRQQLTKEEQIQRRSLPATDVLAGAVVVVQAADSGPLAGRLDRSGYGRTDGRPTRQGQYRRRGSRFDFHPPLALREPIRAMKR